MLLITYVVNPSSSSRNSDGNVPCHLIHRTDNGKRDTSSIVAYYTRADNLFTRYVQRVRSRISRRTKNENYEILYVKLITKCWFALLLTGFKTSYFFLVFILPTYSLYKLYSQMHSTVKWNSQMYYTVDCYTFCNNLKYLDI